MDDKLYWTTEAMLVYGGSFVKALAQAMRLADDDNLQRLVAAFPEYVMKYTEMSTCLQSKRSSSQE